MGASVPTTNEVPVLALDKPLTEPPLLQPATTSVAALSARSEGRTSLSCILMRIAGASLSASVRGLHGCVAQGGIQTKAAGEEQGLSHPGRRQT